jgi:hypothetical protein
LLKQRYHFRLRKSPKHFLTLYYFNLISILNKFLCRIHFVIITSSTPSLHQLVLPWDSGLHYCLYCSCPHPCYKPRPDILSSLPRYMSLIQCKGLNTCLYQRIFSALCLFTLKTKKFPSNTNFLCIQSLNYIIKIYVSLQGVILMRRSYIFRYCTVVHIRLT